MMFLFFVFLYREKIHIGINHAEIKGTEAELAITLAHEIIHAKMIATVTNAWEKSDKTFEGFTKAMVEAKMSKELIQSYLQMGEKDGKLVWNLNPNLKETVHEYMKNDATVQQTIKNAYEEYMTDKEDIAKGKTPCKP